MDRAIPRDARARRAGRVSGRRSRGGEGARARRQAAGSARGGGARGALAAVARLRGDGDVDATHEWKGTQMIFQRAVVKSPVGTLALWANDDTLVGLEFAGRESRMSGLAAALERDWGAYTTKAARDPAGAATRLEQYFAGDLAALDRQPVAYRGSEFQHAVWDALRTIPVGATLSYSELAERIGRRGAMRAVGTANGANRIALFVPCHR